MVDEMQAIQDELDKHHEVGAKIAYNKALIGNGHREGPVYLLADCGIDRMNRLWKRDQSGYTLVADFGRHYINSAIFE